MKKNTLDALEFFIGGVPAQIIYGMDARKLAKLVDSFSKSHDESTHKDAKDKRLVYLNGFVYENFDFGVEE